jgi:hypothetical protein
MSITTATGPFPATRRLLQGRALMLGLLATVALAAAIVAIALSGSSTTTNGFSARPGVIQATGSTPAVSGSSSASGFRDPVTHELLSPSQASSPAVNGSVVPNETPGPGYK